MESRIFRKKFNEFDPEKSGKMPTANLAQLLQGLGVYVPESEIPALKMTLDPTDSEEIKFDAMWQWFQKMSETAEGDEKDGEEDSDED
jgi:Ca2+-binding EF-hand superfamily protein